VKTDERSHDRNIAALKEIIAFFALLACIGSAYHAKILPAAAYFTIFLFLYYEKKIRRWLRQLLQ